MEYINKEIFKELANSKPDATAFILGGKNFPETQGIAEFYALNSGVLILTSVSGLPNTLTNIFAYHIHDGNTCADNFAYTGGHLNPSNTLHPSHSGDMAPLFSFGGNAYSVFYTERVSLEDILGKVVVIHLNPDDFTTQPAGNSGEKIACGVIYKEN